jgi:hypothetical protein
MSAHSTLERFVVFDAFPGQAFAENAVALAHELVRAGGLEPPRGYPQRIFVPATAFAAAEKAFVVWTIPSP